MNALFKNNWDFSEKYMPFIRDILQKNAMHIVRVEVAEPEDDMKHSTDLKVTVKSGDVAVRIRRKHKTFRDITIRAFKGGHKTEIHKLREGYADWYLYAWESERGLDEWCLLDVSKMRAAGLFNESRKVIMNKDGVSGFVAYSQIDVISAGAIVAEQNWLEEPRYYTEYQKQSHEAKRISDWLGG
jgi:hypothetical protein